MLNLKAIQKSFTGADEPVRVLRGIDLCVAAGETVALTGESGSGKSTLLHLCGGLETPDKGQVLLDGVDLATLGDTGRAQVRRTKTGIIFQQFNLIGSLTVADNIRFQARLADRLDETHVASLIERLGLQSQLHKYPEALSGGQQQRVAIARALAVRPQVLLADEPTGNLDETTAASVLDAMLALVADSGTAMLMVTHSPAIAARMGRRVHLSGGQIA